MEKPTPKQTHEGLFTSSSLCPSIPDSAEQGLRPRDCCAQDCESEKPWRSPHRSKHTRVYLQARACVQVYLTVRSRDFDPETVLPKIANPRNHQEADTNANTRGFIYKLELVSKYSRHSGAGTWTPRTPWRTLEAPLGATSISERTPLNHRTVVPKIANPRNHQEAHTEANTQWFIYNLELVSEYT
ncbi:uncharacterized protein [Canis lupus baileyi]